MNNVDLGRRIKQRRTDLGLTQGDIATEVGVAISTIQRYETGSIERVKLPVIEAIARALHVNPDWLVGKTPEREEGGEYLMNNDADRSSEARIAALEYAVKALLEGGAIGPNPPLRYMDGVLYERKPYAVEFTPVELVNSETVKLDKR